MPNCLCCDLANLYGSNQLKLYRGTVSRERLSEYLKLAKNSLAQKERQRPDAAPGRCLRRFDAILEKRGHGTVWTEKIPAIRLLLEGHKAAGTLPVNELGDLNRSAVLREFGLGNASVHVVRKRAPKLMELLDEFDTTREDPTYTQYKYEGLEMRVKELLTSTDLKLTHGWRISLKWIAEQLGMNSSVLVSTPRLKELIEQRQSEINQGLRRGTTKKAFQIGGTTHLNLGPTPYSDPHGRAFSFEELVAHYGLEFAEKVGTVFVAVVRNQTSPRAYYQRIKHFLLWLAEGATAGIAERLKMGKAIERPEFERAALWYQQEVMYGKSVTPGKKSRKHPALTVIERFGEVGMFPRVRFPRTRRMRKNRTRTPRPSLAEARDVGNEAEILELAKEEAQYRGIDIDQGGDVLAFVETLARERAIRDDLPFELPEAIRILCEERLVELRRAASTVFEEWKEYYLHGQVLVGNAEHSGEQIFELLEEGRATGKGIYSYRWTRLVSTIFPENEPEKALANLLALIDARYGGICPQTSKHEWGTFWVHQYRKVGGKDRVQAFLLPPRLVVSAILMMYLCESGTNSEVACAMTTSAVRSSATPRHMSIVGRKARARNKAIFNELPIESTAKGCTSAVEAILFYRDVMNRVRTHGDETPLFVHVARGKLKRFTEWRLRKDLGAIKGRSKKLASLKIVPSMIRPTVLLAVQLKHPSSLHIAQLVAQHKSDTTTMGYVAKLPYRMILEDRIRRFCETLEVIVAGESARTKMGGSKVQWEERMEHAQRTGLGVWCSDPKAGAQPDFPAGTPCHAVDRCVSCSRIVVVADRESVADMVIWRQALDGAKERFLDERTERWEKVWVPWQAFFQVVLDEKMTRGRLAVIKKEGEELARERMSALEFRMPEPW